MIRYILAAIFVSLLSIQSAHSQTGDASQSEESKKSKDTSEPRRHGTFGERYRLSDEERETLDRGEISAASYVIGGVLGTYPLGFGIGHAIQGRYLEKGWIFTLGEAGSVLVLVSGLASCFGSNTSFGRDGCNNSFIVAGAMGFVGFKLWEIIDLWAAPPELNRRYRMLRERMGSNVSIKPQLAPVNGGATVGLLVQF